LNSGDQISRYRILGPLGKGGMGVVYRAEDTRLNRPVALKFLPADWVGDDEKKRFLNEARIAASARHANICPIYDIEEDQGRLFIAMALLEGQTLQQKLAVGPMAIPQAVSIALQIASGLDYAHSLGVVHRDIKAGNIMVDPGGHVSIMDFGLALRQDDTRLTAVGRMVGTPGYMSPEQAQGLGLDRRTDIWSLGVVMFEMLTGSLPFRRDHPTAVVHAIVFDKVPDVTSLRQGVPAELAKAIGKALEKKPEARWQTAGELAAALRRIDFVEGVTQTMAIQPAEGKRTWSRWWLAAVAVLLGVSVPGAWVYRQRAKAVPTVAAPVAAVATESQVAVLPFDVAGQDESVHTVADGLEEVMSDALSNRGTGMIAVPVSEIRRRKIATVQDARRVYGAAYAITGSAAAEGAGRLRFTLNALDAATGRKTGSEAFVYDAADPIGSRDRAVAIEMSLLKIDLTPAAQNAVRTGDTGTPEAYSAYLKGRGLLVRYDVAGNVDKAMALFESAVKADPNYALAWAGLGEAELQKARASGDKKWSMAAIRDAEHAVRLDDSLALAHSVLGRIYANAGREDDAIRELKTAIGIAPGNAEAPRELARVYNNLGRFKEAEASYLQATAARPTDWYAHLLLGLFYFDRERYSEAEAEYKKARELTPDNETVVRNLGVSLSEQGRYPEAIELFQQALKIKSYAQTYVALGAAYYYEHRYQDAVAAAETAIDLNSNDYNSWGNAGIYYKWLKGSEQKSAPSLRRALELAKRKLEATPTDYDIMADVAEYEVRLGDSKSALAQLNKVPPSARKPLASRMAIVYELTGRRADAIRIVRQNLSTAASLNQIRNDPDLFGLWNTPEMRQIAAAAR
jgi:eukaryotic-like serine/threonine-protein kinase